MHGNTESSAWWQPHDNQKADDARGRETNGRAYSPQWLQEAAMKPITMRVSPRRGDVTGNR